MQPTSTLMSNHRAMSVRQRGAPIRSLAFWAGCRPGAVLCALLLLVSGCATSTRVSVYKSVETDRAFEATGAVWLGTRSASVQNAEQSPELLSIFEDAFQQAGFELVEDKAGARYQAYFWFGKRRERREQFSNVTDGLNITTEYTWAMTLEVLSKEEWGLTERYSAEVEMAVWCPSIDAVVLHLANQLVADFPAAESYDDLELVQIFPSDC